ncbi:ubinuclein-1 isoform X2 [Sinocyclocheilus anshuiensis]|uniref:ubinuclein-1 isoform X2 n=1 Tax=Sinocyclocheilus anshuiensis TaxID=1608454 RepID=UPI0007B790AA|nr:PREDICTED: ubinuclein-1-like isoform X2 [Sinocyclocheilus anshuiensis]
MAAPRRIQFTTLSSNARFPLPTVPNASDQPVKQGLPAPAPAVGSPPPPHPATRVELNLFESDEQRCPEFSYPDLIRAKETAEKKKPQTLDEAVEDKERDELEALAKKFDAKYGGAGKRKKDRLQDLVDMGFGYDESDSFIDNSEAYDELVPACLTTRYGGFYINSGTLQFRPAFDEGEENENDCEDSGFKSKKRKLKQGKDKKIGKKKKEEDMLTRKEEEEARKSTPPDKSSAKKKKNKKPLSIDKMLKKFHKEKLQQLQMFNARERDWHALNGTVQAEVQEPPISADPLLTLIGSASADDLLQAVKAAEQDFDLDRLLGEPQNICSPSLEDNGEALVVSVTEKPTSLLPDGLPPTLEQHIKELSQAVKEIEGQNQMEIFSSELNSVLLDVEVNSNQLSGKVRSRIFSYLASQLSCSKGTLVKRAKKLHSLQQDEQLRELLKKLENAVARSMPEQITRFQNHCQAHSEARAAKLEAEKERGIDGSDEEEEERSGKRVFGPRKRFRWNEEIRELLFEIVNLKMIIYDSESPTCSSLEEYLKAFLEADVKPLWPKGWMQSSFCPVLNRILLIETRKAHGHITGVVARKKPIGTTKLKKVSAAPEDSKNNPEIQGSPALKRKRLSVPVSMQPEATLSTTAKTPSNTQTSTTFSTHPSNQNHKEGNKIENHHTSTQRSPVTAEGAGSVQMMWTRSVMDSDSKRLQTGERATPKLTLVAPPDGAVGDCPSVVQGVARLLTTTSVGDTPVSMAAAAGEISCGNPALPTPSLSLLPSSYPTTVQLGVLPSFAPLHALPFPGLSPGTKLPGQPQACNGAVFPGPATGTFQHGLAHGEQILILKITMDLDGSQIHTDGLNARRKLH